MVCKGRFIDNMVNKYEEKYVTVFYIDIRNYTELSLLKEPRVVASFISEYRQTIDVELNKILKRIQHLSTINIGDATLIIIETSQNKKKNDLKLIIEFSKNVKDNLLRLLAAWKQKKDSNGQYMNYFEKKVNFGIGISQGKILAKNNDYIGFAINHAAKIGDMRTLHKEGHIGIDKETFDNFSISREVFLDKKNRDKFIGHTKVGEYIYYIPFENEYGDIL